MNKSKEDEKDMKEKVDSRKNDKKKRGTGTNMQKEGEKEEKSKLKKITMKLRILQRETNFSPYLGAGLYEIALGMGLTFLVSFLIGLPIVMAYPFLNPTMLWSFKIVGWALFILGLFTCLIPFLKQRLEKDSMILSLIWIFTLFNAVILVFLIPIGLFLGLALYQEFKESKTIDRLDLFSQNLSFRYFMAEKFIYVLISILVGLSVGLLIGGDYKLPFLLIPIALFVFLPSGILFSLSLRKSLAERNEWKIEENSLSLHYFLFLSIAGLFHGGLGLLFVFVVPVLLYDSVNLIFPYVTYDTVRFITGLGWINLIPGFILLLSSLWSRKLSAEHERKSNSIDLRIIRILILGSSAFLILVFPIGTFFAIALILEFYYFGKEKTEN
ncbi:MAG: hypothetical protein ACOC35_01930 [Promethearchaeia archaeon]